MTISYVEPVKTYVSSGNGAYPFTFKVLAESDIEVWYTSASTGARVQLVRGSDFSVTVSDPGGTVTILGNAPAGGQILIQRRVPIDQPTNWVNNGPFDMDLLEADLDRIIMIVQQLGWDVSSGQAAINFRGPWAATTAYTIRDIVRTANGNYYFCAVSHTSGTFSTDLAAGNWVLLIDFEAIETHATNAAASAADALASRNTAIARSAAAELSEIAAAASAAAAAADADEIRDWPVSTGLATDVAEHLAFSRKNLLINGGFDVWQRGTSFTGTNNVYTADRWRFFDCVTPARVTISRVAAHAVSGAISPYSLRIAVSGGWALGVLEQRLEDAVLFSGKTITFTTLGHSLTADQMAVQVLFVPNLDTPSTSVMSSAQVISFTDSCAAHSVSFTLPTLDPADYVFGKSYIALQLVFNLDDGHSLELNAGQLEFGDTATDFEYRHPAEELALCKYYFERVDNTNSVGSGYQYSNGVVANARGLSLSFTPKRIVPTVTYTGYQVLGCTYANVLANAQSLEVRVNTTGAGSYRIWDGVFDIGAEL